ncbi:MAG: GNAT family N-acetyltransferase [Chitinophagaceae bacterium]
MITFETANTTNDLEGILELQRKNLADSLTSEEISSQGFVTVNHTLDQLTKLNNNEKHIVAKDDGHIVGYLLAMTQASQWDIPILIPMFRIFNETCLNGKAIPDYNYIVVGQVCIDKSYRGQGLFDNCYETYKEYYKDKYDFAITEIARTNTRSLNAHKRVGFKEIKDYVSPDNVEWVIVVWDWNR